MWGTRVWCLDGNGTGYNVDTDRTSAYLHRCGHGVGQPDYQLWGFTHGTTNLQLVHNKTNQCLRAQYLMDNAVFLGDCDGLNARWDAVGLNGWVMFVNSAYNLCLRPYGTEVPGRSFYWLGVTSCDRHDLSNVPNIIAWRYFTN